MEYDHGLLRSGLSEGGSPGAYAVSDLLCWQVIESKASGELVLVSNMQILCLAT